MMARAEQTHSVRQTCPDISEPSPRTEAAQRAKASLSRMGSRVLCVTLLSTTFACSETTTPKYDYVGDATVQGFVYQSPGTPLVDNDIAISCAGGAITTSASTNGSGEYFVNLSATASVM